MQTGRKQTSQNKERGSVKPTQITHCQATDTSIKKTAEDGILKAFLPDYDFCSLLLEQYLKQKASFTHSIAISDCHIVHSTVYSAYWCNTSVKTDSQFYEIHISFPMKKKV